MQLYNSKLPLNLKSIESIKLHLLINYTFEKSEREKEREIRIFRKIRLQLMEKISRSFFKKKKKMATALTSTILIPIFSNANFS